MISYFKSYNILTEEELSWLEKSQRRILKKGDFIIQEGEICKEIIFIKSGAMRSFYINSEGDEITVCLVFENDLISAYSSFITQQPTFENIQAIADSEIFILSKSRMEEYYLKSINWNILGRQLTELHYVELEKRVVSFQKYSAKERYEMLYENNPEYITLVPLQYIASYLGISARHLSRLRKSPV